MNKKVLIVAVLLLLFIFGGCEDILLDKLYPEASLGNSVIAMPNTSPPADAEQLIYDPSFEYGIIDWPMYGDVNVAAIGGSTGENALVFYDIDPLDHTYVWGAAHTFFDLGVCEPGPVWVMYNYTIFVNVPFDPGGSVSEGFLATSQGVSLTPYLEGVSLTNGKLWELYPEDFGALWQWNIVQIDNLFELLPDMNGQLWIQSSIKYNGGVEYAFDDIKMLCTKRGGMNYRILLPLGFNNYQGG